MDLIQEFEKSNMTRTFPEIKAGDTIRVHQKIKEEGRGKDKKEKERIQVFEGLVIRRRGGNGLDGSFTIRKIASGVGVEKNFPIHMPNIVKIEFVKRGKVRRSNLAYLKDKKEKDARLQEIKLTDKEIKALEFDDEAEREAKEKAEAKEKGKDEKVEAKSDKKDDEKAKPQKAQKNTEGAEKVKVKESKVKPEDKDKSKEDKPKAESKKESKAETKKEDKPKAKPKEEEK